MDWQSRRSGKDVPGAATKRSDKSTLTGGANNLFCKSKNKKIMKMSESLLAVIMVNRKHKEKGGWEKERKPSLTELFGCIAISSLYI